MALRFDLIFYVAILQCQAKEGIPKYYRIKYLFQAKENRKIHKEAKAEASSKSSSASSKKDEKQK